MAQVLVAHACELAPEAKGKLVFLPQVTVSLVQKRDYQTILLIAEASVGQCLHRIPVIGNKAVLDSLYGDCFGLGHLCFSVLFAP